MAPVAGSTEIGMMREPFVLETPANAGILLPSRGIVEGMFDMIGMVDVPISMRGLPETESTAIGTRLTPSVLETPHQMGILFWSRITELVRLLIS